MKVSTDFNEKRILNKSFRPLNAWTGKGTKLGKGEVWEFVKKNPRKFHSEGSKFF